MNRKHRDGPSGPDSPKDASSRDADSSPTQGTTTTKSGYPEKHGPRFDPDGWGEANSGLGDGVGGSGTDSQGHAAGERSFDNGSDDQASAEAASDAALRKPGERVDADAQRDHGQGYVHSGKPGPPDPDGQ